MKQALIQDGKIVVWEVPCPVVDKGCILVAVEHSCISIGTEMSSVRSSAVPLWRRALKQPDKIIWVLNNVRTGGLARTRQLVEGKVSSAKATGYSAAGTVVQVGEGVEGFAIDDRVACAGGQCAYHAEMICVPVNLAVPIPDNVTSADASTVALGAIALQGVRRATPTLGENFVVIGLGIIGQITAQILKANGCRVIGMDIEPDRIETALALGMNLTLGLDGDPPLDRVARLTNGVGVDGVIITAATPSSEVISNAFSLCRKKGRVVLVGDVGLDIKRQDIYAKEIDFFISTSYGPGRYDRRFEEEGLDYPISYVRWTENRNMQAYIDLLSIGRIKIEPLVSAIFPIESAAEAYARIEDPSRKPLAVLLSYRTPAKQSDMCNVIRTHKLTSASSDKVRVGIVGVGSFLKGTHLPNLRAQIDRYKVTAVVSKSGHNAADTARQVGATIIASDLAQVVADPEIDAFIITTRHNLHAPMTLAALRAGKHVLCEKPLALTHNELSEIKAFYDNLPSNQPAPLLLTGYNRRFSPYARRIKEILADKTNPLIINYRMCGGYMPPDHWIHGPEGGGRNLAEACHIYDFFNYITGARVAGISATAIRPKSMYYSARDNFVATVAYEDGSVATLSYTVMGSKDYPKEQCEIYCDGKVLVLTDYQSLTISGSKAKGLKTPVQDKGHNQELVEFAESILHGTEWPILLWQQIQAMEIAFEVEAHLAVRQSNHVQST